MVWQPFGDDEVGDAGSTIFLKGCTDKVRNWLAVEKQNEWTLLADDLKQKNINRFSTFCCLA